MDSKNFLIRLFISAFKYCKKKDSEIEQCYFIDHVSLEDNRTDFDGLCQSFIKKSRPQNETKIYTFHRLNQILSNLINRGYSIQIKHNVKFVFKKIRFSSGLNLIDHSEKMFVHFSDDSKIKSSIAEFDSQRNEIDLISPFNCYTRCMNQNNCNSFSLCKYRSSKRIETKCILSDLILVENDENDSSLEKNSKLEQSFVEESKNCQTYTINFLKHFKSKGQSMFASSNSLRSYDKVDSAEECARKCYLMNKDEKVLNKCGKLEVCNDGFDKFQCNLKPYSFSQEDELKDENCEYFKINSLVDYYQTDLNEDDDLIVHSVFGKIDDCAKDCSINDCPGNSFNFCFDKSFGRNRYDQEDGICLFKANQQTDSAKFNSSTKALNCFTFVKNDHVIALDQERNVNDVNVHVYRYRFIKVQDENELDHYVFDLFIFAFSAFGFFMGWIGFSYYSKRISPAYLADPGTYYPTRIRTVSKNLNNQTNGTIVTNYSRSTNNQSTKLTKIEEDDEFTDIQLT